MNRTRASLALGATFALLLGSSLAQAHTTSFTIDRDATLSPGGTFITVSGRITCGVGHFFSINVNVTQGDGQNAESAGGGTSGMCLGTPQLWEVQAQSFTGPFHAGKATASANAFTQGPDGFDQTFVDRVLHLR
jgi:Family of unknown function (DUF6299)